VLTLSGSGFENEGGTGGLRLGDFTFRGQGGATYTLGAADAAVTSETAATITLAGTDLSSVRALLDNNGTTSLGGTTYNLATTAGWDSDAGTAITTEGVTVSGLATFDVHVYLDTNDNGVQDGGDAGLGGVTVNLLDGSGNPLGITSTTDAGGDVSFTGLVPGSYEVSVDVPTGDVVTQTTNIQTPNTLTAGETVNAVEGVTVPVPVIYNPDNVVAAAGAGAIALDIAAPTDVAGTPTVTLNDIPTYGTVQYFNGSAFVVATSGAVLTPTELASLEYIPPASGEFGGQTISYTAAHGSASIQGTIAITVVADDTGPASLYFSAYGNTGNSGNPDLYTLNASGDPVAMPLNVAYGSSAGEDGGFFQFAGNLYFNASGTATSSTEALFELTPNGTVTAVSAGANNSDGFFDAINGESADFTEYDGSL
jgi:SdrD B-like domain